MYERKPRLTFAVMKKMEPAKIIALHRHAPPDKKIRLASPAHHQKKDFPLRVAAVDIGSNAIRFLAAEFLNSSRYIVLESERAPIRLGAGTFSNGRLASDGIKAALQALARFQERLRILNIQHYRVIATSAVRESTNGKKFAQHVYEQLGIPLEIVSGSEETQLVYRSLKHLVPLGKAPWLLANLGGGSLEVALVNQSGVLTSETHTIGAVRLLEDFKSSTGSPRQYVRLLKEYVATLRLSLGDLRVPLAGFIATGGNIEELAKMADAPQKTGGIRNLSVSGLKRLMEELPRLSVKQRMVRWGMYQDRADVVVPAAVVYAHLAALSGQKSMLVPYVGTKEGILLDLADRLTLNSTYTHRKEKQLLHLTVSLGRRYQFHEAHGQQVCRLALALFEQLQTLHGLDQDDHRILMVAALLHDIGAYISYKKHHKHSLYLIAQSELPGFSSEDMLMAANIARYHRKNSPQPHHDQFARLTKSQRLRVAKMASLLRIADALDRDHAQTIKRLNASVRQPYLDLKITGTGFRDLEHWSLQRKAQLFTDLFGLRVRIVKT
ncbi:MAG: Ppx/GppA family phosphatase [Deltaproteobacteria bacterium]|nr:Ppx/GppA family phosphatase [Deltaproteobacteria bacterium]